jgi:hypothetical protein
MKNFWSDDVADESLHKEKILHGYPLSHSHYLLEKIFCYSKYSLVLRDFSKIHLENLICFVLVQYSLIPTVHIFKSLQIWSKPARHQ